MNDLLICSMGTAEDRAGILSAHSNGQAYQYLLMLGQTQAFSSQIKGESGLLVAVQGVPWTGISTSGLEVQVIVSAEREMNKLYNA